MKITPAVVVAADRASDRDRIDSDSCFFGWRNWLMVVEKVIIELADCWVGGDQASCDGRIG